MPSRTVTIASSVGLHAGPAAIVEAVSDSHLDVTIGVGRRPVDAASILGS
jgi:phosphocarrier protein